MTRKVRRNPAPFRSRQDFRDSDDRQGFGGGGRLISELGRRLPSPPADGLRTGKGAGPSLDC